MRAPAASEARTIPASSSRRSSRAIGPSWVSGSQRGAATELLRRFGEALLKLLGDRLDDDEALRGDAALAGVLEARGDRDLDRLLEVRVAEHDERVRAAELQHYRLDRPPAASPTETPAASEPVR